MKLVFMGTPDFAVPTLQALIDAPEHQVVAAYTQPPRPAGRGHKPTPSPVQRLAEAHRIPVFTPVSLKPDEEQARFRAHRADAAVVAAYGLILPRAILDAPRYGCLNVHPSDLPRWRGAAPIQRCLMAGDTETAMCIMQMDAGLDTGDVLWREPYRIPPGMDAGALHDVMARRGAASMLSTLAQLDTLTPRPQQGEASYAPKITKDEARIDWSEPAETILSRIRGLSPYPAARAQIGDEEIKIFAANIFEQRGVGDGDELLLAFRCGDGQWLRITELQRPGKTRMAAEDALRGWQPEN